MRSLWEIAIFAMRAIPRECIWNEIDGDFYAHGYFHGKTIALPMLKRHCAAISYLSRAS